MENKKTLMFIGIFALVLLSLAVVSAGALTITPTATFPATIDSPEIVTVELNVTYTGTAPNATITWTGTTNMGSWTFPTLDFLNKDDSQLTTATLTVPTSSEGALSATITATTDTAATDDETFTSTVASNLRFCKDGAINTSNLDLNVDISNFGEGDDEEWFPLDRIEIEIELDNEKDIDLNDVVFEIAIIEKDSGKDIADEMVWISEDDEKIEIGDVDEDEKESHIFEFKVDAEAGIDDRDYLILVKAYPDGDEDEVCIDFSDDLESDFFQAIKIEREDADDERAVLVDTDEIGVLDALCGQQVVIPADVYNIGDADQQQTKVLLRNTELGINLESTIKQDLDEGDKETIDFMVSIPSDAVEKTYTLEFITFYDYDDDDDTYDETSEEFEAFLRVQGNCGVVAGEEPSIAATLSPGTATAVGEELAVQVSITNNAANTQNFVISATGFEAWAGLSSIEPQILNIPAGSTQQATIKLSPTQGGSQTFNIQTIANGETSTQPVTVSITEKTGFLTGAFAGVGNTGMVLISAIVLILIIIVIVLIVKIASSSGAAAEF